MHFYFQYSFHFISFVVLDKQIDRPAGKWTTGQTDIPFPADFASITKSLQTNRFMDLSMDQQMDTSLYRVAMYPSKIDILYIMIKYEKFI